MFQRALFLLLVMSHVGITHGSGSKSLIEGLKEIILSIKDTAVNIFTTVRDMIWATLKRLKSEYFGDEEGCIFKCPNGAIPISSGRRRTAPNGCGSHWPQIYYVNKLLEYIVYFPDLVKCCDQHDECYDSCDYLKKTCDDKFRDCLKRICTEYYGSYSLTHFARKFTNACSETCLVQPPFDLEPHIWYKNVNRCYSVADFIYEIPNYLGCKSYRDAQRNACVCLFKD